ncbi:hypothetical protein EA184_26400 [Escherichia coli]|nr:hypothetical protein EA184_26400 [Escherichia coli]RBX35799.1 hypothetical protein DS981_25630 [Escherichia coli]RBX43791.1 hypothetical protein DS970_26335 [Escherichia coli]RBY34610.1 hypothetical protein DS991_27165 [Escherichia coli]RCX75220.1 hypothetical protein DTL27_27340 [Escherichia coli]
MGSCTAPSAKGDDKFITTDYLQQCLFLRELSSAFTRTKGGEAPPLIRPPEISPRQAEGRASLTGRKARHGRRRR